MALVEMAFEPRTLGKVSSGQVSH